MQCVGTVQNDNDMKRIWPLPLLAIALLCLCSAAFAFGVMFERDNHRNTRYHADPTFAEGFEKGVRYGLLAKQNEPKEDDLGTLTAAAKGWYWLVEVKYKDQHNGK